MLKTTHNANEYDRGVVKTIPFYETIRGQILDLTRYIVPSPVDWLDAGCGTGSFAQQCLEAFPDLRLHLADPSVEMLAVAKERLANHPGVAGFTQSGSEELDLPDASFDVISAVLSHHYFRPDERRRATENCLRLLRPGGLYVSVEHVAAYTEKGRDIALARWRDFQVASGKTPEQADRHVTRYDEEYFPITPRDHVALLRECGFAVCELFWYSYSQVGIYGIK